VYEDVSPPFPFYLFASAKALKCPRNFASLRKKGRDVWKRGKKGVEKNGGCTGQAFCKRGAPKTYLGNTFLCTFQTFILILYAEQKYYIIDDICNR
jgi:hypothetical protein